MDRIATLMTGSFGRFLTSGVFNTLVTYLLYLALLPWLFYRVSYTIAYVSGIALAYALNRYLVFRKPGGRAGPLLVVLIYAGQYIVSLALVTVWVRWFGAPAALAPLFAIAVTLPLTYLLNRRVFSGAAAAPAGGPAALPMALFERWGGRAGMAVLIGLPVLSLAINAVSWLRYGLDLPFFDDWRGYHDGDIDSLDPAYLFKPVNDTLTPIGFGLDALAQRFLDGNSIVYQFLSMVTVLGLLLLLQWKLLAAALADKRRAAICFVFTLFMLQPGSYWGRENMAYHQALPLVFILLALWLATRRPIRDLWNLPLVFVLGIASGLSYISGAFGALAAGAGMLVAAAAFGAHESRRQWVRGGSALALAGAVASALQLVIAVLPFKGGTHQADKPLALPTEPDFWFFFLGKLGRSLLLPAGSPVLSLFLVVFACVLVTVLALLLVRAGRNGGTEQDRAPPVGVVFGALSAMVLTYMALVAAGRTHYRPDEVRDGLDVFSFAFQRFHFFWATLLWPWALAAAMVVHDRLRSRSVTGPRWRLAATAVLVIAVVSIVRFGALDHVEYHQREASARYPTVACLMEQLQKGEGIDCREFNLTDLTQAYVYARQIGASFVRYFPVLPIELGTDTSSPWFRLSRDAARTELRGATRVKGAAFQAGDDAQLHIDIGHAVDMASCVMLDVRGVLKVAQPDTLKLYFLPVGQQEFNELSTRALAVEGGDKATVFSLRLEQPIGFESRMRLDPVASRQPFELTELEVRCRLKSRYDTIAPFYAITQGTSPGRLESMRPTGVRAGQFRAGEDAQVLFRTGHRNNMASCRLLEVQAIYKVEVADSGRLFFRPKGVNSFSDQHSVSVRVAPEPAVRPVAFIANSATGFEDELRFDPVERPQDVQFEDIKVRCLKRVEQVRGPG